MAKPASDKPKRAAAAKSPAKLKMPARAIRYAPDRQQALWDAVIAELEGGKTLNKALAAVDGAPTACQFLAWAKVSDARLKQYAEARRVGYEKMADQILDIADEDELEGTYQNGKFVVDLSPSGVARNRLRVDTRKWLLSKCLPKIYGDNKSDESANNAALADQLRDIANRLPV